MVDVREQEEYDMAHIDGVDFLMPSSDIVSSLTKIQSIKKPIVIYCRTDRRSKSVHEYLKEKGLKSCYVKGGITEYKGKIIR
jgi:rhodanese-related sulfurtransferase